MAAGGVRRGPLGEEACFSWGNHPLRGSSAFPICKTRTDRLAPGFPDLCIPSLHPPPFSFSQDDMLLYEKPATNTNVTHSIAAILPVGSRLGLSGHYDVAPDTHAASVRVDWTSPAPLPAGTPLLTSSSWRGAPVSETYARTFGGGGTATLVPSWAPLVDVRDTVAEAFLVTAPPGANHMAVPPPLSADGQPAPRFHVAFQSPPILTGSCVTPPSVATPPASGVGGAGVGGGDNQGVPGVPEGTPVEDRRVTSSRGTSVTVIVSVAAGAAVAAAVAVAAVVTVYRRRRHPPHPCSESAGIPHGLQAGSKAGVVSSTVESRAEGAGAGCGGAAAAAGVMAVGSRDQSAFRDCGGGRGGWVTTRGGGGGRTGCSDGSTDASSSTHYTAHSPPPGSEEANREVGWSRPPQPSDDAHLFTPWSTNLSLREDPPPPPLPVGPPGGRARTGGRWALAAAKAVAAATPAPGPSATASGAERLSRDERWGGVE